MDSCRVAIEELEVQLDGRLCKIAGDYVIRGLKLAMSSACQCRMVVGGQPTAGQQALLSGMSGRVASACIYSPGRIPSSDNGMARSSGAICK